MVINFIFEVILWSIVGALPGFYVFFLRQFDTRQGVVIGAILGMLVGLIGLRANIIASPLSAVVIIFGLLGVALLLLPEVQSQYKNAAIDNGVQRKVIALVGGVAITLFLLIGITQAFFGVSAWIAIAAIVAGLIYVAILTRDTDQTPASLQRTTAVMIFAIGAVAIIFVSAVPTIAPIIIMLAGTLIFAMMIPSGGFDQRQSKSQRITNLSYVLLIPTMLIVLGIVVFPVLWNVIFSVRDIEISDLPDVQLFDVRDLTIDNFVAQAGLRIDRVPCVSAESGSGCNVLEDGSIEYVNPRRYDEIPDYRGWREVGGLNQGDTRLAIGARNEDFYPMLARTLGYTLSSTILAITFGLIAALIVRDQFPGRTVFRGFILFPYIAPVISVAFVWQILLRQSGLVNAALGTNIDYLGPSGYPLMMVILFQVWRYFPFAFLFLLARIQAIPTDIYEAAKVDGATPIGRLWHVTLPQLRAVFGTLFLLRFIWTFNKFDDIFLLTGPIQQTKVIPIQIYLALFNESNVGEASAVAVIMAAILAVILLIYFRYFLVDEV